MIDTPIKPDSLGLDVTETDDRLKVTCQRKPPQAVVEILRDHGFRKTRSPLIFYRELSDTARQALQGALQVMNDRGLDCQGYARGQNPKQLAALEAAREARQPPDKATDTVKVSGRITQEQQDWLDAKLASDAEQGKRTTTSYYLRQAIALYMEQNP